MSRLGGRCSARRLSQLERGEGARPRACLRLVGVGGDGAQPRACLGLGAGSGLGPRALRCGQGGLSEPGLPVPTCSRGHHAGQGPHCVSSKGACVHVRASPISGAGSSFSLLGSWPPGAGWQEVTLPWGPQLGLGSRVSMTGENHLARAGRLGSARPGPRVASLVGSTLNAPPGQAQPWLLPGQQGDGRSWMRASRPGQPMCRAAPQSSEPQVSAQSLRVCPSTTRSPDLDCRPLLSDQAPTWATATQGGPWGADRRERPAAGHPTPAPHPLQPRTASLSTVQPHLPECPHLATQCQERKSLAGLSPGEPAASCALGSHALCVC